MNTETLATQWQHLKDAARRRWDQLDDEDLATLDADATRLARVLRARYGWTAARARAEIDALLEDHGGPWDDSLAQVREGLSQIGAGSRTTAAGVAGLWRAGGEGAEDALSVGLERARAQSHQALDAVGDFVRQRPMLSLGIAFAAGYWLLARRR
jgi:ElaB/YqjD/DUF883 family membrane-anchored ribosome-binding protein